MLMKSTALCRVLLFVCALSLLLLCYTVNVNAHGSNSHAAQMEETTNEGENTTEEEIKKITESVWTAKKKVSDVYATFVTTIDRPLEPLQSLKEKLIEVNQNFLTEIAEETNKMENKLTEPKEYLIEMQKKVNELQISILKTLQNENKNFEIQIKELMKIPNSLARVTTNSEHNIGDKDKIDFHEAKELNDLANEITSLAKKLLDKITKHNNDALDFVKILSERNNGMEKTVKSIESEKTNQQTKIIYVLKKLQMDFLLFVEDARKTQVNIEKMKSEATNLHSSCEGLEKETKELQNKIKPNAEKVDKPNEKIINGEKGDESDVVAAPFQPETGKKPGTEDNGNLQKENIELTTNVNDEQQEQKQQKHTENTENTATTITAEEQTLNIQENIQHTTEQLKDNKANKGDLQTESEQQQQQNKKEENKTQLGLNTSKKEKKDLNQLLAAYLTDRSCVVVANIVTCFVLNFFFFLLNN